MIDLTNRPTDKTTDPTSLKAALGGSARRTAKTVHAARAHTVAAPCCVFVIRGACTI